MFPADVFHPGTKGTDDPKCPLPALIFIATVSLCAKPEIDGFADDRRVGRLATYGDAAYRGGLPPGQLNLFPLHAIMMAQVATGAKPLRIVRSRFQSPSTSRARLATFSGSKSRAPFARRDELLAKVSPLSHDRAASAASARSCPRRECRRHRLSPRPPPSRSRRRGTIAGSATF